MFGKQEEKEDSALVIGSSITLHGLNYNCSLVVASWFYLQFVHFHRNVITLINSVESEI